MSLTSPAWVSLGKMQVSKGRLFCCFGESDRTYFVIFSHAGAGKGIGEDFL